MQTQNSRIALRLERVLFNKLKKESEQKGISMSRYIREILENRKNGK